MWALRRASIPLKNRGFATRVSVAFSCNSDLPSSFPENSDGNCEPAGRNSASTLYTNEFNFTPKFPSKFSTGRRSFSSKAGAKRSGEGDDLEEGFSELEAETLVGDDAILDGNDEDVNKDELTSDSSDEDVSKDALTSESSELELSDDENDVKEPSQNEFDLDTGTDVTDKELPSKPKRAISGLVKAIIAAPALSVRSVIDKWIEEGKEFGRPEYKLAMRHLRKDRMYGKALQLSEWLEKSKKFEMVDRDYASRLDLIGKIHGLFKAQQYIEKIPKSFRGEVIYRTLLASAVAANDLSKAEKTFNKMKDLEYPLTTFVCNQLLLLYKRLDKKKIGDVLLMMEKENLKPDLFTYNVLIDTKGQSNDMTGMEQIVETMKEEGIEPDAAVQVKLARHYIFAGQKEKAEAILEKIEKDTPDKEKRRLTQFLLPLYASLQKTDDVQRLWELCESNPDVYVSAAVIGAFGKLNKVEEAEAVFNKMVKAKKDAAKHYSTLLKVYADRKMLAKGKELVNQMSERGCPIGPLIWDALVRLYIEAGELEKADSILQKAVQKSRMKPMFNSYMLIMDQYAKRGDVHNTEKIFYKMRQQSGYYSRLRQFQSLITAYVNGNTPLYGMRERMKADNIFPNRSMAAQLAQVDAFKKTAVSELLE